jgi:hypothetical protein
LKVDYNISFDLHTWLLEIVLSVVTAERIRCCTTWYEYNSSIVAAHILLSVQYGTDYSTDVIVKCRNTILAATSAAVPPLLASQYHFRSLRSFIFIEIINIRLPRRVN